MPKIYRFEHDNGPEVTVHEYEIASKTKTGWIVFLSDGSRYPINKTEGYFVSRDAAKADFIRQTNEAIDEAARDIEMFRARIAATEAA